MFCETLGAVWAFDPCVTRDSSSLMISESLRLFVDAIKQIPKYAKFLKELCTTKRAFKLKGHETVSMGEVVSAVVQKNLPLKQKDPGAFTIPCVIGNASFKSALCDLGASISVMPKHVYDSLSLEPLNKTSIVIQLADRSFVYPLGVIEDVLVVAPSRRSTASWRTLDWFRVFLFIV